MSSYFFIFFGNLFLFFLAWYTNTVREGSVCVKVPGKYRKILHFSGRWEDFSISGIIIEIYAYLNLIPIYIFFFVKKIILHDELYMKIVNLAWIWGALGVISIGEGIETMIVATRSKTIAGKMSTGVISVLVAGFGIFSIFVALVYIYMDMKGVKI